MGTTAFEKGLRTAGQQSLQPMPPACKAGLQVHVFDFCIACHEFFFALQSLTQSVKLTPCRLTGLTVSASLRLIFRVLNNFDTIE